MALGLRGFRIEGLGFWSLDRIRVVAFGDFLQALEQYIDGLVWPQFSCRQIISNRCCATIIGAMYGASEKQTSIWHLEGYAQEHCAGLQCDSEFEIVNLTTSRATRAASSSKSNAAERSSESALIS